MTETVFAKKIGMSQTTYNRFEAGGSVTFPAEAAATIIKNYNVNYRWLLLDEGDDNEVMFGEPSADIKYQELLEKYAHINEEVIKYKTKEIEQLSKKTERLKNIEGASKSE